MSEIFAYSKMQRSGCIVVGVYLLQLTLAVKVKVVMHSEEDSKMEEEETPRAETWDRKTRVTLMPFIKTRKHADEKQVEYEEEKSTTEKPKQLHPNEMIFPLIYRQSHINSMFKFGENWYTWSTEKRNDGSKATNYYICYDEPKRCDDIGWVLQVRIIKDGWLHKGGVICPPCREVCGAEFEARKEYCKGGEEPLPPNLYPNDILKCDAVTSTPAAILATAAILLSLF